MLTRPPIIPQDSPRNTSQCTINGYSQRPWLLMDHEAEQQMMRYWKSHTVDPAINGFNKKIDKASLGPMTQLRPDRPWLHGVHRNIDHESMLSGRDYYNPEDCITQGAQKKLNELNRLVDNAMVRRMTETQLFRNGSLCDDQLWNQSTSLRQNEPINFDYERYVRSCHS